MTKESCTNIVDLGLKRLEKKLLSLESSQESIGVDVTEAICHLKEAERLFLKAHIAMEDADWEAGTEFCKASLEATREWARRCQRDAEEAHITLRELCQALGVSDPFSSES